MGNEKAEQFLDKLKDMTEFLIPNYILEGKNRACYFDRLYGRKTSFRNVGERVV